MTRPATTTRPPGRSSHVHFMSTSCPWCTDRLGFSMHLYCVGDPTGAEKHAFHNLVWFDHLLRTFGPLFPFMVLATRFKLGSLAPEILAFDRQPWLEQLIVYIGITLTRTGIYYLHRLGEQTTCCGKLDAKPLRHCCKCIWSVCGVCSYTWLYIALHCNIHGVLCDCVCCTLISFWCERVC